MTTPKKAAHKAAAIAIAPSCADCKDNFNLPELHDTAALAALDVFDGPAIRGQIERRRTCTACPDAEKPCLKPAPAPTVQARAAIETVAPTVPTAMNEAQLRWALECIAGRMATLNELLMLLAQETLPYAAGVMVNAAQQASEAVGAMADDAVGGVVIGDMRHWLYGTNFAGAGTQGKG